VCVGGRGGEERNLSLSLIAVELRITYLLTYLLHGAESFLRS